MIYLFTDFGWAGPYVGEMKAVLARHMPGVDVVDLMHDAPVFNPRACAYLLAALSKQFKDGDICLGVVDPGVGASTRRPILLEAGGIRYVGPDNGLFAVLAHREKQLSCREILWRPQPLSASFHGRDLFAPAVCQIYRESMIETKPIPVDSMAGKDFPEQLAEIIYIDHFGNAVTGLAAKQFSADTIFTVMDRQVTNARTFSDVQPGELFWYENSMGLVELAANCSSAKELLNLAIGSRILFTIPGNTGT